MKARILFLPVLALAGLGASYALANSGKPQHGKFQSTSTTGTTSCRRVHAFGTASSPQTVVVTVTKSGPNGALAPGQVVTVAVGGAGQTVAASFDGCLTGASSVAGRGVMLHAFTPRTTTGTTSTGTTTTGKGGREDDDGGGHHGHHHGHRPPTTTGTTTTGPGG
ncbi:MAG TPA: hypothetical protein VMB53_07945 [Gaiellaceae bacterium]|nr:hypothetical protein [Gaiellaceae bacterium]